MELTLRVLAWSTRGVEPAWEDDDGLALRDRLVALVHGDEIERDLPPLFDDRLRGDATATPRGVADQVVAPDLDVEPREKAGVAHPVGDEVAEPRYALGAVVIRRRHTDRARKRGIPVDALRRLGHAEVVGDPECGVALEEVEGQAVGAHVEASPPLDEGDDGRHRERPFDHRRERLADLHVLPVPRRGAADLLRGVGSTDPLDLVGCVALRLARAVLLQLVRGVALGPEAPRVRLADDRSRVV